MGKEPNQKTPEGQGDREAEGALEKLQEALETVRKVLGDGPQPQADEFLVVIQELQILDEALQGSQQYPREVLRGIARQAADHLKRLGWPPLDEDGLLEFLWE